MSTPYYSIDPCTHLPQVPVQAYEATEKYEDGLEGKRGVAWCCRAGVDWLCVVYADYKKVLELVVARQAVVVS